MFTVFVESYRSFFSAAEAECLALPAFWTGTNKHRLLDFNRKAFVPLSNYLEAEGVIQRS